MTAPLARRVLRRWKLELALGALVVLLFGDYLFSDRLLYGTDSIPGGLFFRGLLVDFVRRFHEVPRWNPYILGGLPFIDATHGDTFFPSAALQFLFPVYRALGHKLVLHVFVAGVCMAFYLRSLALRQAAVAWGALAYMLCPVFVSYIYAGQDGKMYVTSLCPLVLGLLERAMRSGGMRDFLLLGTALGFAILSAHIQMAYHLTWFLGALFLLRLWRREAGEAGPGPGRLRLVALFAGSTVTALLIAAIQLFPAVAYVKHPDAFSVRSTRTDYEHASSWSLHPEEVASMVVPEFCNSPRGYWGRNAFKLNSDFVGILPLFLSAVALRRRDPTRVFLAALAAFCVLYALGGHTPVHRMFYAVVPQVKLFRAPPLVMFGAAFALCALAAHAVHDLGGAPSKRAFRPGDRILPYGLGLAAVLALLGLAAPGVATAWNDLLRPDLEAALRSEQLANLPAFRSGALVLAAVVAAAVGLLEASRRGAIPRNAWLAGLLLLTVVDEWRVDRRYIAVVDPRPFVEPSPLLARMQTESRVEKFRVLPVASGLQANEMGYFGIESVLGFHDNELSWYRALRMEPAAQGLLAATQRGYPFLRTLNVKYVLHEQADLPNPFPVPDYLARLRVAGDWELAAGSAEVASRMLEEDFDPARTVLLEEDPGFPRATAGEGQPGRILDFEYDGNVIRARIEAQRPCLVVHAENWFPYWHAFVNGTEVPILRAYGTLRAIAIPAGLSDLEIRYRSVPYRWGRLVTAVTLAAVLVAGTVSLVRRKRTARGGP